MINEKNLIRKLDELPKLTYITISLLIGLITAEIIV